MTDPIALASEQTIYQARDTHQLLAHSLQEHDALSVDLAVVTEVDSSFMQILLWLQLEAQRLNKPVHLLNPSPTIKDVVALLGLEAQLTFEVAP